jgi:integrase
MSLAASRAAFAPPEANTWVFDPQHISEDRRWMVPHYGDATWSLLALNKNPSAANEHIWWARFPDAHREQFRHAAWALINFPLPPRPLARLGAPARSRLSVSRMSRTVLHWARFARWMDDQGIDAIALVDAADLTRYTLALAQAGLSRNTVIQHLAALSRLHAYSIEHLPLAQRLVEPPWLVEGMDDYLPAATPGGENVTEPISPETLGPLLIWSLRMVEDLSPDILAARAERSRLVSKVESLAGAKSRGGLVPYLERLRDSGDPFPSRTVRTGHLGPATVYIAALTDTPISVAYQVLRQSCWREVLRANPGPAPLNVDLKGRIGGQPWRTVIDFGEVDRLTKHLVDACFIVIAYLTGMRPGEILGLEEGCCPEPQAEDDGSRRHLIWARQYKNARDRDGNHLSEGEVRDVPWLAVPQVVRAIRVLEEVVGPGQLLFDALTHDIDRNPHRAGRSMATATVANRIEPSVAWFNNLAHSLGRPYEAIPPDPDGRIGLARFRRTLAWHIARRPGGLVALALQYGHMRTIVSEGYASRARGGIHELLDVETARVVAENLSDLHEALQNGEGVSGPAARRTIFSATHQQERFGGQVLTLRQAQALLADPTLTVYVNEAAHCLCNYDRSKALCQVNRQGSAASTPSLDRCSEACSNICRTDTQADRMTEDATVLLTQADSGLVPRPVADRMTEHAHDLQRRVKSHRENRITVTEVDDD